MADPRRDSRDAPESRTDGREEVDTDASTAVGPVPTRDESSEREQAPPAFAPEQVLAERYRIVRYIAAGAMGEVYEAEDLALGERVALKTIAPEIAARARSTERFKREIQLARRVSHPNVCRIHEFGSHRYETPDGKRRDVLFLTMELLSGETLIDRIIAKKRLSPAEALPIMEQIASALDAAHAAGVIHRDFKSGNVVLDVQSGSGGVRAVVTDFGLARSLAVDSGQSISDTGTVVGTAAYMAPEQVRGDPLTPAADIYAFGIVMYETVTGYRPFGGGSALSVAVRRLTDPPPPPRTRVPDLDPRWEMAILRCLAIDPAGRFPTASDAVKALRGSGDATGPIAAPQTSSLEIDFGSLPPARALPVSAAPPATSAPVAAPPPAPTSQLHLRHALIAGALILMAALGYVVTRRGAVTSAPQPAAPAAGAPQVVPRRAVAVLGLKNVSGRSDADWVGTAVSEILTTDLGSGSKVRMIPAQEVARAKTELDLRDPTALDASAAARLHGNLGADLVVVGSYTTLDPTAGRLLRIDLRLVDGPSGRVMASGGATGTESQLFGLVARAAEPLRTEIGLGSLSPAEAVALERSLPAHPEASRLYLEGLAKLRVADAAAAKEHFEKALAAEPKHPLIHSGLAGAWLALGFDRAAREEAKAAAELAGTLSEPSRLAVEARYYEASRQWPKAIEAYRSLLSKNPDDLDTALLLADAQTSAGAAKEALATLDGLGALPTSLAADPRIDLARARAHQRTSDSKQLLASATAAAQKANARGARLLLARARQFESAALDAMGEKARAASALEEARGLYETLGDRAGLARVLERIGFALKRRGDLDGARRMFDRALVTYRASGDRNGTARVLQNTGTVLMDQGRLPEAQKLYDEALATFRQVGAKYEEAATLTDLGAHLQLAGDLAGAAKRYEQALALFEEVGRKNMVALTLTNLAEVMFLRGDLKRAEATHSEALALNRELGDKAGQAYDIQRLGDVAAARGDLRTAEKQYERAHELQKELGDDLGQAECRLGTAAAKMASAQFAAAETLLREVEETFRTGKAADRQAMALALLVKTLLAQGKVPEAQETGESLRTLVDSTKDRLARWHGAMALARLRAASGKATDVRAAQTSLEAVRAEAARAGFLSPQLESRLDLGEIEVASGSAASGRARLKALAGEADAKGFGSIAKRSRAVR